MNSFDDYEEIYRLDMNKEWECGAYDENGDAVSCDQCGGSMKWEPKKHIWYCADCGQEIESRAEYMNYIGADPPGSACVASCHENYPFCKKHCVLYPIKSDDPML